MPLRDLLVALAVALATQGCAFLCPPTGPVTATLEDVARDQGALALSDALEELIAEGKDTPGDRQFAYDTVRAKVEPTAEYAFARAAITGRLVQLRGLTGANLVGDVEKWALECKRLSPDFRKGAALRLLGTLYVFAPSAWVEHGDSEAGISILEDQANKVHPEILENHLRLAEGYIALHDTEPAKPYLCKVVARRLELRKDDQALLDRLVQDAGPLKC